VKGEGEEGAHFLLYGPGKKREKGKNLLPTFPPFFLSIDRRGKKKGKEARSAIFALRRGRKGGKKERPLYLSLSFPNRLKKKD